MSSITTGSAELTELRNDVTGLRSELSAREAAAEALQSSLEVAEDKAKTALSDLEDMKRTVELYEQRIADLQVQMSENGGSGDSARVAELEADNARLNETITTYEQLVNETNAIVQAKEEEIQHILNDTNSLMAKLNELDVGVEFTVDGPQWYKVSEMPDEFFQGQQ